MNSPMPAGLVTFLDPTLGNPPDNWEIYQDGQGRLLLATAEPSLLGTMVGTPVAANSEPTHTHSVSGSVDIPVYHTCSAGGRNKGLAQAGATDASGDLAPAGIGLGFMHLPIVRSLGDADQDPIPYGAFAFFDRTPPAAWKIRDDLSGYFLLPSADQSQTFGTPWDPADPPGHSHSVSGSLLPDVKYFVWGGGANPYTGYHDNAPLTGTATPSTDPVVPYVALYLCEKISMPSAGGIPKGLAMFFGSAEPPSGWRAALGADDRFVVGLPSGGEPCYTSGNAIGATGTHSHTGAATTTLTSYRTDLLEGGGLGLAHVDKYTFPCQSNPVQITLPAITARLCVYTGN